MIQGYERLKYLRFVILYSVFFTGSSTCSQDDENVVGNDSNRKTLAGVKSDEIMDLHLNFNADGHFCLVEIPGSQVPEYDDSDWRVLDAPHDWSVEGRFAKENPGGVSVNFLPTGIGCYRKYFVLPEGPEGKRIKIRFDRIYMNSSVY